MISLTGLFALLSLSSGAITTFSVVALVALYGVQLSVGERRAVGLPDGDRDRRAGRRLRRRRDPPPRRGRRRRVRLPRLLTFTIGTFDLGVVLLVAAMAAAGFLGGMIMPSRDMLVRAAAPPGMAGRVFGIVTTGFNIGGTIGPMIGGWLMDHGEPRWIFYSSVCFMTLTVLAVLVGDRRSRRRAHGMALLRRSKRR